MRRLQWVLDNVRGLEAGRLLCWITGWSATTPRVLEEAVDASGARALLRHPAPPAGARAPLLLANPAWARPFEVFPRAFGMPSGDEADPSRLLAVAVPLMFGYMFGDVGQGLVIAAAGFVLRHRFALARLFIAGGLSAALFGFVFGSVFGLHLMTPWWVAPLDAPLAVLAAPLVAGALLLLAGLALSALGARWRGELGHWLTADAGLVACYMALLAFPLMPAGHRTGALGAAGAGVAWFCLGRGWSARSARAGLTAAGELLERLLQLLMHTLSFARVGAFALAHAGLSAAIAALAAAAGHPLAAVLVLVLGNAVVIALEGLVVSIQTTRLVLFEFFARFLEAQGRVFRPLPAPPSPLQES
jgi:V/A-type H+-transporting ATPase subunit I